MNEKLIANSVAEPVIDQLAIVYVRSRHGQSTCGADASMEVFHNKRPPCPRVGELPVDLQLRTEPERSQYGVVSCGLHMRGAYPR